jgi:hypothetical protein
MASDVEPLKYIRNLTELLEKIRKQAAKVKRKCKKPKKHKYMGFQSTLEVPIPHQLCQKCGAIRLYGEQYCE